MKKCLPWAHRWVNLGMTGIFSAEFIDRCDKCKWWKVWGVDFAGSWRSTYPPEHFVVQKNKRTKVRRIIPKETADKRKKWRWQK